LINEPIAKLTKIVTPAHAGVQKYLKILDTAPACAGVTTPV